MPVQTSQEEITSGQIEEANEPEVKATVPTTQEEIQETNPLETVGETEQVQQPAESVAATVNAVDTAQHVIDPSGIVIPDWITVDLIHINNVSRPAIALDAVNDIAIHYVANPGSSAKANRDYFDSLDNPAVEGAGRQASAHLIVGLVFHLMRWHMQFVQEIQIRFQSKCVIQMRQVSFQILHTIHL